MENNTYTKYGKISHRERNEQLADFFSEEHINIQEWVQEGILEINGNISPLKEYDITFSMLLKLAGYASFPEKKHFKHIRIHGDNFKEVTINIISEEFMCLNVGLNFAGMSINNYKCFREPLYANTQGIVLKGFVHQVSLAKQLGFRYIYGTADDKMDNVDDIYIKNVGYFYRPMLGFFHDEEVSNVLDINIQNILLHIQDPLVQSCKSLNDLLHLRNEKGERIGLTYWKEYGYRFPIVFDLADDSNSLQILKEYIAKKQYEKPEKYGDLKL